MSSLAAEMRSLRERDILCVVGQWRRTLDEEDREEFDYLMDDSTISSRSIIRVLADIVPFSRTALLVHRNEECMCQN
jgi:hypothetical protein